MKSFGTLNLVNLDLPYIYIYIYILTGNFLRYISYLLELGWTPCLNPSWDRLNKVHETFLRDFYPY